MLFLQSYLNANRYESRPGIGAGSIQGFQVAVAFLVQEISLPELTLWSNHDGTNGWRINQSVNSSTGAMTLSADLRRDNATTLTESYTVRQGIGVAFLTHLEVGSGPNAEVRLWLNGNPVIDTTLGVGLSFAPAANTPLRLGGGLANGAVFYAGAAFSSDVSSPHPSRGSLYIKQIEGLSPGAGIWENIAQTNETWTYAWDTRSLLASRSLEGGLTGRAMAGPSWLPAPGSGSEILTSVMSEGPSEQFPLFVNLSPVDWGPIASLSEEEEEEQVDLSVLEHVYISQANGDDANSGSTPEDPIATLASHVNQFSVPPITGRIFHFDSGSHSLVTMPEGWGRFAPLLFMGDGAGQSGDDGNTVLLSGTAGGGTTNLILDTPDAITSAHIGKTVRVTSGVSAGEKRTILEVVTGGTNQAFVTRAFSSLSSGDTFEIVEPAVFLEDSGVLSGTAFVQNVGSTAKQDIIQDGALIPSIVGSIPFVLFSNVDLNDTVTKRALWAASSFVCLFGVELPINVSGNGNTRFSDCTIVMADNFSPLDGIAPYVAQAGQGAPTSLTQLFAEWGGWGFVSHAGGFGNQPFHDCNAVGYYVASSFNSPTRLLGGTMYLRSSRSNWYIEKAAVFSRSFSGLGATYCISSGSLDCIHVENEGIFFLDADGGEADSVHATGTGRALFASAGGRIDLQDPTTVTADGSIGAVAQADGVISLRSGITLSSSASFGASVAHGGRIYVQGTASITGSTPGTNDITEDGVTNNAFASIVAAGAFIQNGASTIQRVS